MKNILIKNMNELELEKAIIIYNNTKNSSTGYAPDKIFNSIDQNLLDIVKKNIINSQKYNKKNGNLNIENKLTLLCENFKKIGKKLIASTFGGKGRYIIPVFIIRNYSNNEYEISI